jgi:hypothetical protein
MSIDCLTQEKYPKEKKTHAHVFFSKDALHMFFFSKDALHMFSALKAITGDSTYRIVKA